MFEKKVLESTVKVHVKQRLKELGAYQHWPVQLGMGDRCLDCHGCYQGSYFAIEAKAPGKKPTPIQLFTIEQIRKAGGVVLVIDSVKQADGLSGDHLKGA